MFECKRFNEMNNKTRLKRDIEIFLTEKNLRKLKAILSKLWLRRLRETLYDRYLSKFLYSFQNRGEGIKSLCLCV